MEKTVFRGRIVSVEVRGDKNPKHAGDTNCCKNVDLHAIKIVCHWPGVGGGGLFRGQM